MKFLRRLGGGLLLVCVLGALLLAFTYQWVFSAAGAYLVESSTPVRSDAVVVLAGDTRGARIMQAADLVRNGYAPVVLVSGPMDVYDVNEATLAIQYAVNRGVPARYFEPVVIRALSTQEEAREFAPELRRRNIHSILLVTSNYHTKRAAQIFRGVLGPDITVRPVAAPDKFFRPDGWWHNREGQKTLFFEYSKTVAVYLGL